MQSLDRIMLFLMIIGVWALVLKPNYISAHSGDYVTCNVSGSAWGDTSGSDVEVWDWGGVSFDCYVN